MSTHNEDQLVQRYPVLFREWRGDPQHTCMAWGLETPDGWDGVLNGLCAEIDAEVTRLNQRHAGLEFRVVAEQVKEKWGTLRFYYRCEWNPEWLERNPEASARLEAAQHGIAGAVGAAERITGHICSACGTPVPRGEHWHRICTRCETDQRNANAERTAKFLERRAEWQAEADAGNAEFRDGGYAEKEDCK